MATPHRLIDSALDGLADAAAGLITDIGSGVKGAGGRISTALDKPPTDLGGPQGIHHIVGRVLDGVVDSVMNLPTNGVINSLKKYGEGICRGLDQPEEQFGIPPKEIGVGKLPKPFKK